MVHRGYIVAALVASHAALIGWAGWAELRVRAAQVQIAERERAFEAAARAAAEEITRLQEAAVTQEREAAQELAALAQRHQQEQRDAQARTDATLTDLRRGTLRLRQRLAAAECPAGVPGPAAATAGGDAAGATGLRAEDAEFLVRESDRADRIVRRLTLCQQTISQYRRLAGAGSSTAPKP